MQVGQELEDVLIARDALKAVNQELAKRVMGPGGPCTRCQQASALSDFPSRPDAGSMLKVSAKPDSWDGARDSVLDC